MRLPEGDPARDGGRVGGRDVRGPVAYEYDRGGEFCSDADEPYEFLGKLLACLGEVEKLVNDKHKGPVPFHERSCDLVNLFHQVFGLRVVGDCIGPVSGVCVNDVIREAFRFGYHGAFADCLVRVDVEPTVSLVCSEDFTGYCGLSLLGSAVDDPQLRLWTF